VAIRYIVTGGHLLPQKIPRNSFGHFFSFSHQVSSGYYPKQKPAAGHGRRPKSSYVDCRLWWRICSTPGFGESHFLGGLAEVRMWNRALSETEVSDLYHFNTVPEGLVAEWLLWEETGTTAFDTIGGHDGTISGAYRPVR
jgi:hypothetical protein